MMSSEKKIKKSSRPKKSLSTGTASSSSLGSQSRSKSPSRGEPARPRSATSRRKNSSKSKSPRRERLTFESPSRTRSKSPRRAERHTKSRSKSPSRIIQKNINKENQNEASSRNNNDVPYSPKTAARVASKRSKLRELEVSFSSTPPSKTGRQSSPDADMAQPLPQPSQSSQKQKQPLSAWEQRQQALKAMNGNNSGHSNPTSSSSSATTSVPPKKNGPKTPPVAALAATTVSAPSDKTSPNNPSSDDDPSSSLQQPQTTRSTSNTKHMIKNDETGRYIYIHKGSPIYEWKQTFGYLFLYVKPPPFITHQQQVNIAIMKDRLKIGLIGKGWFINEETFEDVLEEKSKWGLEADPYKGGKIISIQLCKLCHGEVWGSVLTGGDPRDDVVNKWNEDSHSKAKMYKDMMAAEQIMAKQLKEAEANMNIIYENSDEELEARNRPQTIEEAFHESQIAENALPLSEEEKQRIIGNAYEYLSADIRLFSSCQDDQQANDNSNVHKTVGLRMSKRSSKVTTDFGGVFTSCLLKTLYGDYATDDGNDTSKDKKKKKKNGRKKDYDEDEELPSLTYGDVLNGMRGQLEGHGYSQTPMLTASRPISTKDHFDFLPDHSTFTGTRKALIIGINYAEDSSYHIPGCQNDAHNMIKYLKDQKGFGDEDFYILMDNDNDDHRNPTRENILKAFHRFAFGIQPGDAAFIYYAGHGKSTLNDGTWDDESATYDQVMLPVDFETEGGIVDDEIFRVLLVPIPEGVQVTAIIDCCHSGSIFDLPFEFVSKNNNDEHGDDEEEIDYRAVRFPHMGLVRHERNRLKDIKNLQHKNVQPEVIEKIMIQAPTKKRKQTPDKKKGRDGGLDEDTEHGKYMKFAAVEEPMDPEQEKIKEERELVILGCLLLCLNPIKLCRVLWS